MSYLIEVKTNVLIAYTNKKLKGGERVKVGFDRCKNNIDANREWDLVNPIECKASNAKKWAKIEDSYEFLCSDIVEEINENEFFI